MEVLLKTYREEIVPELIKKFKYKSIMEVPKLDKVVINMGLRRYKRKSKGFRQCNFRYGIDFRSKASSNTC